jgi:hypothetical protein
MEISKEEFDRYENVRESGVTNMFNVSNVAALSGLHKEKVISIMKNYSKLYEQYK